MGGDDVGREALEAAANLGAAAVEHPGGGGPQQLSGALRVAGVDRVVDRAIGVAGSRVPVARPPVQLGLALRSRATELRLEHVSEERVIAVGPVRVVERDDEQVRARHVPQHVAGPAAMQDRVAHGAGQLVEHRRLLEEGELLGVEPAEQLVAHVVRKEPIVSAEARDRTVDVLVAVDRQGGEIEPGRPALGALEQHVGVLRLEVDSHQAQHRHRLAPRHHEVARPEVEQPPLRTQAPDREVGLPAAGRHQLRAVRHRVGDRHDHALRLPREQVMQVVEHEHERLLAQLERVGQLGERGGDVVERVRDRGHEPIRVVVQLVDGQPRDGSRVLLEPVLEQRRLPVPRGRDEQRERHVGRLREAAEQPLAPHGALANARAMAALGRPVEQQSGPVTHLTVSIFESRMPGKEACHHHRAGACTTMTIIRFG